MSAAIRLSVLGLFLFATSADAFLILSPDDVCAPDEDPCIIDQPLISSFALPLDFGLRTVRVTGEGSLRGNLDLLCGAFESDGTGLLVDIETPPARTSWWGVRITARRSCSGDETVPCLVDADCDQLGAGTCSQGDGGIRSSGDMIGGYVAVKLVGAGDVALKGVIRASAPAAEGGGGSVLIQSTGGSVDVAASIDASIVERMTTSFANAYAGEVEILAAKDLRLRRTLRVIGHHGEIYLRAGNEVVLNSSILGRGRPFNRYGGTSLTVDAGGEMRIERGPGRRRLLIDLSGGGGLVGYALEGGDGTFRSGGSLTVGEGVRLRANSGRGVYLDDEPYAGDWVFSAGGDLRFDGRLHSRGRGRLGWAGAVGLYADGSIHIGPRASVNLRSTSDAGSLEIFAGDLAAVEIEGDLHLEGSRVRELTILEESPSGGDIEIGGGDVRLAATVKTGGRSSNGGFYLDACRFHLASGGSIVTRTSTKWADSESIRFLVYGSLLADAGSEIVGLPDSEFEILYGDQADPPRLLGAVSPQPELTAVSYSSGCPVCGDGERELWEACDDGNRASGDGCDVRCELEIN